MEAWIGPAIIAAAISSGIGLLSLFINAVLTIRIERTRRLERVRDVQIALLSEIRADIHNLQYHDLDSNLAYVLEQYEKTERYVVKPSAPPPLLLEDLLKKEVQILPSGVIDFVFLYVRQRAVIEKFVEDMRADNFSTRDKAVQINMYTDYIEMKKVERTLARGARDALQLSLESGKYS